MAFGDIIKAYREPNVDPACETIRRYSAFARYSQKGLIFHLNGLVYSSMTIAIFRGIMSE